jgi:tetratricopeptide (TPR) repeat protein/transcriptional regulator with XRE-family HTH domain
VDLEFRRPSAFGASLVRYRHAAGLTQEALAEASGMSVRALRDLEQGRTRAAQQRSAEILADALGLRGSDHAEFLAAARAGRRRAPAPAPVRASSWLPPPVELVGRAGELARLRAVAENEGGTVVVVGPPGVGKTALAVFAANSLRSLFPDGGIWVDLRGMDDHPLPVGAALERLLRWLGVSESDLPVSDSDRVDVYRAMVADRRVLVLLDNVADEAQVRPLLAGGAGPMTLVTCRRALAGLADVRWLWVEPLGATLAVELLAGIVGDDRVRREPDAAAELVALCGNLPLAVRIASNRLASRPRWSLAYLVEQLRDERVRLGALSVGDLQVRSAFEVSYRRLSPGARLVFRRLAAVPGTDFGGGLAAVVTGLGRADAFALLDELVDAGLLQTTRTDGRFQYHDLIRLFAHERWQEEETSEDRGRTSAAVLGHLVGTAHAAAAMYLPDEEAGERAGPFGSVAEATEWLELEESNWVAALRVAAGRGWHREVLDATGVMARYADVRWTGPPWTTIFQLGVDAARALGDRSAEAKVLNHLGWARNRIYYDIDGGLACYRQALAIAEEVGDRREQSWAHVAIGGSLRFRGDTEQGLAHTRTAVELAAGTGFSHRAELQYDLGRVLEAAGRYEEALSVLRAVLESGEDYSGAGHVSWRHLAACITMAIASCLQRMGEWRRAAETFDTARGMYLDAGSTGNAGDAALKEGRALREAGEHAMARECFHDALALYGSPVPQRVTTEVHAELALLPEE